MHIYIQCTDVYNVIGESPQYRNASNIGNVMLVRFSKLMGKSPNSVSNNIHIHPLLLDRLYSRLQVGWLIVMTMT